MIRTAHFIAPVDQLAAELACLEAGFDAVAPGDITWPCDPPADGREHWEAVWTAVSSYALDVEPLDDDDGQIIERAKSYRSPIEPPDGRLILALLPRGDSWLMVEADESVVDGDLDAEILVLPLESQHPESAAVWHLAAEALTPVALHEFVDIDPRFFLEACWDDDDGELREWHEAAGFANLPTDPRSIAAAEHFANRSKLGGFPAFNAFDEVPPKTPIYAAHLSADFFDVMFGDAASLHVWLAPDGRSGSATVDSASAKCPDLGSPGGAVSVSWRVNAGWLELSIADEGPGLIDTANLFVPFFTTKPGGSGIGLALSRQIADGHGGRLTLENRADRRGCEARLRLPLGEPGGRPDVGSDVPQPRRNGRSVTGFRSDDAGPPRAPAETKS